jgi:hypothetical protein
MTDTTRLDPTVVEPLDLEAAAAALCCRFGEPSAEAYRLTTLHDLLSTSRALARALDSFTALAAEHYRGVHNTSDMRADAHRLAHALADWSDSVFAAGGAYREWKADGAIAGLRAEHPHLGGMTSFTPIMHDHLAPTAPPA